MSIIGLHVCLPDIKSIRRKLKKLPVDQIKKIIGKKSHLLSTDKKVMVFSFKETRDNKLKLKKICTELKKIKIECNLSEFIDCLYVYFSTNRYSDSRIEKMVGRKASGSGFCFLTGKRDMGFNFRKTKRDESKLKQICKKLERKGLDYEIISGEQEFKIKNERKKKLKLCN